MALLSEMLSDTAAAMGVELPQVEVILLFGELVHRDQREGDALSLTADPALRYTSEPRYVALHAILLSPQNGASGRSPAANGARGARHAATVVAWEGRRCPRRN
jgi:hypothetical protein